MNITRKFTPLLDRILVQKVKLPVLKTKSGIILPDAAKSNPNEAVVLAVGSGKVTNNGDNIPCNVNVGDTVLVPEYGGMPFKFEDEEFHIFRNDDIIGVFKKNN